MLEWVEVDLGSDYRLAKVDLYNRNDTYAWCCGARLNGAAVQILDGSRNILQTLPTITNATTASIHSFAVDQTARYIRVQHSRVDNLHLAEIKVYGYPNLVGLATTPATPVYTCPAGQTQSGTGATSTCTTLSSTPALISYTCPAGYGPQGTSCVASSRASTAAQALRYFQQDHLGSIAIITDEAGQVVERLAYDPWGKRRFATGLADKQDSLVGQTTDRGYTEHEHLDEVGVIHMNGRLYDPLVGRFMSADPFVQNPYDLRSFNRYSYVYNNPLKNFDPSGYCTEEDGYQACGGIDDFGVPGTGTTVPGTGITIVPGTGGTIVPGTGGYAGNLVGPGAGAGTGNIGYTNSVCGMVQCAGTNLQMGLYSNADGSSYAITNINNFQYINSFVNSTLNTGAVNRFNSLMSGQNGVLVAQAGGALSGMYGRLIWGSGAAGAAGNQGSTGSSGYDYVNGRPASNNPSVADAIWDWWKNLTAPEPPPEVVYRVWGGGAKADGRYWSPINPDSLGSNYRDAAGLPNENTGTNLITGLLVNRAGVEVSSATPLDGNRGGLVQYFIPDPNKQVKVISNKSVKF